MEEKRQKNLFLKKLLYIVVPLFVVLLAGFGWMLKEKYFPPKAIHYHAGFIVVKDDEVVDFTDVKYMHAKPCGDNAHEEKTAEEKQIDKGHLHDYIGDVVHVHIDGARWKDLFINLKYPINYAETEAYINGEEVNDFEDRSIQPYESVVLFIGKNDVKKHLTNAVKLEHIKQIEKKSDNCGTE